MFRFELDPADLLAVRFETRPGPLDDVGGASRALRQRPAGLLSEWRRAVLPRLTPATAFSLMLHPPVGTTFGFAVPMGYCLEEGLQAVLATPKAVLREEIDDFVSHQGALPGPLRDLDRGDSVVLQRITTGIRSMYTSAISPYEAQLNLIRDTDVALRALRLARDGLASTINSLHPSVRLRGLVLEIDRPRNHTVRSPGHGIALLPSPWLHDEVRVQSAADSPIKLVYPARLPLRVDPSPERSLGRLLGGTRARLLAALSTESGRGTGALAVDLGISAATASEHLAILREARLITTERGRNGATHQLTPAGKQLLGLNLH